MICYWHMDAVRCKRSFLTVSAVGFFSSSFVPFSPLYHLSFLLFLFWGNLSLGGKQPLLCWKRELIRLVKKAHYWF